MSCPFWLIIAANLRDNMTIDQLGIIILAAGKGKRMQSNLAKVLHPLAGRPIIAYVLDTAVNIAGSNIVVVIGNQAEQVREQVSRHAETRFAYQEIQMGTGHAVHCAMPVLDKRIESVVILCGDVPLISEETLGTLVKTHQQAGHTLTLLAVDMEDPSGYGRIVTNGDGRVERIVEEADATEAEKKISTINSGIYCVRRAFLETALPELKSENAQNEIYLTDIIGIASRTGEPMGMMIAEHATELLGINTPEDLKRLEALLSVS